MAGPQMTRHAGDERRRRDGGHHANTGGGDSVRLADGTPVGEPITDHVGSVNAVAVGTLPGGARVIVIGSGGDSESESESARGKHDNVGRRIRKVHGHQRSP